MAKPKQTPEAVLKTLTVEVKAALDFIEAYVPMRDHSGHSLLTDWSGYEDALLDAVKQADEVLAGARS